MSLKKSIISIILAMSFVSMSPAYDYYTAGKKAFKENDYEKAAQFFAVAVKESPTHIKTRYYYAQTLINIKDFEKAQKQYEKIIELSPFSYEAKMATIGISEIEKYRILKMGDELPSKKTSNYTQNMEFKAGDNYIENALSGGKVIRWHSKKMPIKLYIEKNINLATYKASYYSDVLKSMDAWVNSVGNNRTINYKLVESANEAQIRVYFTEEIYKNTGSNIVAGLATPFIKGNILQYVEVKLIPQKALYATSLHELGHALGIQGHSSNEGDIMYSESNIVQKPSERDLNTLAMLYTLDPDVSNFENNEKVTSNTGKNEKILGSKDSLLEKKLNEAIEYAEKYPDNTLAWVHLGKAYFEMDKFELAAQCYQKALSLDPANLNAIESLAFAYKSLNKMQEAAEQFSNLVNLDPKNIPYSNNYAYFLIENKNYPEAEKILDTLIKNNPAAKTDANIMQLKDYLKAVNKTN